MIRVVWLCYFSNEQVRQHLPQKYRWYDRILRIVKGKTQKIELSDIAVWNTNAIREFEYHKEIDLHVISPCSYLADKQVSFEIHGIKYYFFRNEEVSLKKILYTHLSKRPYTYKKSRRTIISIIKEIKPDIVHLIGAENPFYSLSILDIPKSIKTIVQLQTLVGDPVFDNSYPISSSRLAYLRNVEREVLLNADYVGTKAKQYVDLLHEQYGDRLVIIPTSLALSEDVIKDDDCKKEYDFVYFALNINKAVDIAIKSFAKARETVPNITLDIIGGYTEEYKRELDAMIGGLNIKSAVFFEGKLETHNDVIKQIRKSRFALLPLKVDIVAGTIREAMANGLPVITTITEGTPKLNEEKQCVLLSPIDDIEGMANNMISLLNDVSLADMLRTNSLDYSRARVSNSIVVNDYIQFYKMIIKG